MFIRFVNGGGDGDGLKSTIKITGKKKVFEKNEKK